MEVFLFDIHVFVVKIPLATPVSCSTMATAIAEHARMFVSVKKCKLTASISLIEVHVAALLGTHL